MEKDYPGRQPTRWGYEEKTPKWVVALFLLMAVAFLTGIATRAAGLWGDEADEVPEEVLQHMAEAEERDRRWQREGLEELRDLYPDLYTWVEPYIQEDGRLLYDFLETLAIASSGDVSVLISGPALVDAMASRWDFTGTVAIAHETCLEGDPWWPGRYYPELADAYRRGWLAKEEFDATLSYFDDLVEKARKACDKLVAEYPPP